MRTYPIPMVPGPVKLPQTVLDAYQANYGSADMESEFLELYNKTEADLKIILGTKNQVVIQSGEGMLALWGALKSCLLPGDRVLSIATGVFGDGIGDMASSIGAEVIKIRRPYNETISDMSEIEEAIVAFKPKMITVVHCETPSGTLNPIKQLGQIKKRYQVPLLYVDAVASVGGTPVLSDAWHIDLCLGGSQKCLSSLPDMSFLSVSNIAWEIINQVKYVGYDALQPFQHAQKKHYFPYTPSWHGVAGLYAGAGLILKGGLDNSYDRHESVASYCRKKLIEMGFSLFPAHHAIPSPTVTAVNMPETFTWSEFDTRLRQHGLVVGGSYGPLAGKVFRLGHMGTQADRNLVELALNTLSRTSQELNLGLC
ncbi:MAG: alanine--glyoxylate aminotransferase family protein [Desulfobacterales bacterium]|nr:MAG: alanine--glyoxylate aminotransferase family protein [Desulfobacterales bacterium]